MKNLKLYLILAVVALVLAAIGGFLFTAGKTIGQSIFGRSFAEEQLREYVARVLKQEVRGVNCQPVDRDENGYVSCDFTTEGDPNRVQTVECAAWGLSGFFNRGCKVRMPSFPSPPNR